MTFGSVNFLKNYEKLLKAEEANARKDDEKFFKAQEANPRIDSDSSSPSDDFYNNALAVGVDIRRVINSSKIISQIIAYLWLNSQPDESECTRTPELELVEKGIKWFQNPTSNEDSPNGQPNFQNLLTIGDPEQDRNDYDRLLKAVFPNLDWCNEKVKKFYQFPIYKIAGVEKGFPVGVSFEIDTSVFNGYFKDPDLNNPNIMSVVIAFPPCPELKRATFTKETLEGWIANRNTNQITPPSPYIPTCSC